MSPVVRTVEFAAIIMAVLCLIWCAAMVTIITVYGTDGVIAVFMANVMTPAIIYSMVRAPQPVDAAHTRQDYRFEVFIGSWQ